MLSSNSLKRSESRQQQKASHFSPVLRKSCHRQYQRSIRSGTAYRNPSSHRKTPYDQARETARGAMPLLKNNTAGILATHLWTHQHPRLCRVPVEDLRIHWPRPCTPQSTYATTQTPLHHRTLLPGQIRCQLLPPQLIQDHFPQTSPHPRALHPFLTRNTPGVRLPTHPNQTQILPWFSSPNSKKSSQSTSLTPPPRTKSTPSSGDSKAEPPNPSTPTTAATTTTPTSPTPTTSSSTSGLFYPTLQPG